jgi:hypothetical protein
MQLLLRAAGPANIYEPLTDSQILSQDCRHLIQLLVVADPEVLGRSGPKWIEAARVRMAPIPRLGGAGRRGANNAARRWSDIAPQPLGPGRLYDGKRSTYSNCCEPVRASSSNYALYSR